MPICRGAAISQFENHICTTLDLLIGGTTVHDLSAMANFIDMMLSLANVLRIPGPHYREYGEQLRPSLNLSHATLMHKAREEQRVHLKYFSGLEA